MSCGACRQKSKKKCVRIELTGFASAKWYILVFSGRSRVQNWRSSTKKKRRTPNIFFQESVSQSVRYVNFILFFFLAALRYFIHILVRKKKKKCRKYLSNQAPYVCYIACHRLKMFLVRKYGNKIRLDQPKRWWHTCQLNWEGKFTTSSWLSCTNVYCMLLTFHALHHIYCTYFCPVFVLTVQWSRRVYYFIFYEIQFYFFIKNSF